MRLNYLQKQNMLFRRMEGATLKSIGDTYGIHNGKVGAILAVEIRKLKDTHYKYIEDRAEMLSTIRNLKDEVDYLSRTAPKPPEDPSAKKCILSLKISELGLSVRGEKALQSNGVYTIGDLIQLKKTDIFRFPNFGRKSMNELVRQLGVAGAYILDD